jgi:hypothetical protein
LCTSATIGALVGQLAEGLRIVGQLLAAQLAVVGHQNAAAGTANDPAGCLALQLGFDGGPSLSSRPRYSVRKRRRSASPALDAGGRMARKS